MSTSRLLYRLILINSVILYILSLTTTAYCFHDSKSRMRRCAITIESDYVYGTGNISNYILRLYRANLPNEMCSPTDNNRAQSDGGDIVFSSDSAGATQISSYVYRWEYDSVDAAADAEVLIFVEIPTLDYDDDTTIYMHWKPPTPTYPPRFSATYGLQDCFSSVVSFWPLVPQETGNETPVGVDCTLLATPLQAADAQTLLSDNNSGSGEYAAWPSVTRMDDGTLICAYRENGQHNPDANGGIIIRQSTDNGLTWSAHSTYDTASVDDRDPNIIELESGELMLTFRTRPDPGVSTTYFTVYDGSWGTAECISTDRACVVLKKPVYMSSGDILFPAYGYSSGTTAPPAYTEYGDVWAIVWDQGTETYAEYVFATDANYSEWCAVEDPSTPGTIHGFFRNEDDYDIYKCSSSDYGVTWGAFSKVIDRSGTDSAGAPPEAKYYGNDLYLVYSDPRTGTTRSYLKRSDDDGDTFESDFSYLVYNDIGPGGAGYYPSFDFINKNEVLSVVYEDSTTDGYANCYWTLSSMVAGYLYNTPVYNVDNTAGTDTFANGIYLNGSTEYFAVGTVANYAFVHSDAIFSISAWIKLDNPGLTSDHQGIFANSMAATEEKGFRFYYSNYNNPTWDNQLGLDIVYGSLGNYTVQASKSDVNVITDTNAHRVTVTCDGTNVKYYIDGGSADAGSTNAGTNGSGDATRVANIGRHPGATPYGYFDGQIKMLVVRNVCITEGHAQTEYANENAPSTFAVEGAPTSGGFTPKMIIY